MPNQNTPQYNMLTAGKVLKARRLEMGKSIQQISVETKIQAKYIELIESDQYKQFDSDVFLSGYIKIYAAHMALDVGKVLALYRRASSQVFKTKHFAKKNRSILERFKDLKISEYASPKNIIALILTLIIVGILGYLSIQFYNFQKTPLLEISSPENNLTTNEDKIVVEGKTEENASVEINGQSVNLEDGSKFKETILLNEGNNTITVKAIKENNKSQETVIVLNVKYQKEEEVPDPDIEDPVENEKITFKFNIVDEPVWIQVNVDGQQEFAQILNAGFTAEFEVTESLFVSTGKPNNTEIFINGVQKELEIAETGTGSLTCEVLGGELICN